MLGVSTINIELTSRCNKNKKSGLFKACHMCGRRRMEKENPKYNDTQGDMPLDTLRTIAKQLDPGTLVQLHWNGEPTLYKDINAAATCFKLANCYVTMDTNGLMLGNRRNDLLLFDSITVSVIQGDSRENYIRQGRQIQKYFRIEYFEPIVPMLNIRALGRIPKVFYQLAKKYNIKIIQRIFHSPQMSRDYSKHVTIPEIGVCMDLLNHPAIDRFGSVYPCVRINPTGQNYLGNVNDIPLAAILDGPKRRRLIRDHFAGRRDKIALCADCDYWGIPRG